MANRNDRVLSFGLLVLRILMGSGIAYHGYGKVIGGQVALLTGGLEQMGFPFPIVFAWAAALSEFLGGIFIVIGFKTRIAAMFVFFTMSVAAFIAHAHDPFNIKELALAYWTMSLTLILTGAGKFSIDGRMD